MKSVTILSTIKNIKDTADLWLNSLVSQDYDGDYNIVIVDSYSTDGTREVLEKYCKKYGNITVIELESSQPQALNYAIKSNYLTGDLVALIDGDCIAEKKWLRTIMDVLEEKDVDAVGGPGLTPANSNFLQKLIGLDLDMRFLTIPAGFVKRHPNMNLLVKRAVLQKLMFDEDLKVGYDADFCYRFHDNHYKLWYYPEAIVWHNHRSSFRSYVKQQYNNGKYALYYNMKIKRSIKGDNINSITMVLQPLLFVLLIFSAPFSVFDGSLMLVTLAILTVLMFFISIDVAKVWKIKKDSLAFFLYVLYTIRLIAWSGGALSAVQGYIKLKKPVSQLSVD